MIIEISVENFLSIKDKLVLSLDSSSSNKLPDNLINLDNKEALLKSIVIYGANASGKSNLIKAIYFMWNMIRISHSFNINNKLGCTPFRLDSKLKDKPSKFEILFIINKVKYKYGFSCNQNKIIDEYLYYWPKGRISLIFDRKTTTSYEFSNETKSQQELIKKQMNDNVLYLSRATQLGFEKTKPIYEFIINNIVVNYNPSWANFTIRKIFEDPSLKKEIIEVLQSTDFGGIEDIIITKDKRKVTNFELKLDNAIAINPSESEEDFYDIKFIHKDKNNNSIEFNFNEESDGTKRALSLLGPLFDILEQGKTVFIDEFELRLHPNITRFLVRLFNSKRNKKNAQIVFTTHDTTLLDNKLFRRDQIYLCSKKPNQGTELNSYLDYDLRESTDFEKAYFTGRVGGLPFIDETILEEDG